MMNEKVGLIINKALKNKDCDLVHETLVGKLDLSKEDDAKKIREFDASFNHITLFPVNCDAINHPMENKFYKLKNIEEHSFVQKEILSFLEGEN